MKYFLATILSLLSFVVSSSETAKLKEKIKPKIKAKVEAVAAPCKSKEDLLKEFSEKQKADVLKPKAFSLQGGDTGCSVK